MAKKAKSASGKRNSSAAKPAKKPSAAAKKASTAGVKAKAKAPPAKKPPAKVPAKSPAKPAIKAEKAQKSTAKPAATKSSLNLSKAKAGDKSAAAERAVAPTGIPEAMAETPKVAVQAPLKDDSMSPAVESKTAAIPAKPVAEKKAKSDAPAEKKTRKSKALTIALDRAADLGVQWNALFERSRELEAPPYKMSETYEAKTPLQHKVLGWGFILSIQNDRLEVLFKDGIKILISNYKA